MNKIGFWKSAEDPSLPMPVGEDHPWKGLALFSAKLRRLEDTLEPVFFRGFSLCRLCHTANGSTEFSHGGFVWPEGLRHYVEDHNVRPPQEFIDFILKQRV